MRLVYSVLRLGRSAVISNLKRCWWADLSMQRYDENENEYAFAYKMKPNIHRQDTNNETWPPSSTTTKHPILPPPSPQVAHQTPTRSFPSQRHSTRFPPHLSQSSPVPSSPETRLRTQEVVPKDSPQWWPFSIRIFSFLGSDPRSKSVVIFLDLRWREERGLVWFGGREEKREGRDVPCAHMAAPILFEILNTSPIKGILSISAAINPNTSWGRGWIIQYWLQEKKEGRKRTAIL